MMAITKRKGWTPPGNRSNQHIQRWNRWLYPRSTAASGTIRNILDKPRKPKTVILAVFRIGQVVTFRKLHYRASGKDYQRGVVVGWHRAGLLYYHIDTGKEILTDIAYNRVHPVTNVIGLLPAPKTIPLPAQQSVTNVTGVAA